MALRLQLPWSLAALAAAPTVLACQPDAKDDSFRIVEVEFDKASAITLSFSRPVAPVDGVDPNDFRLSVGQTLRVSSTYAGVMQSYEWTRYFDLSVFDDTDESFSFSSVELGAPNQLILTTATVLPEDACTLTESFEEEYADGYNGSEVDLEAAAGIYLHYAAGDIPLTSEAGEVLRDYAAEWALGDLTYDMSYAYGFPDMHPRLQLPCP